MRNVILGAIIIALAACGGGGGGSHVHADPLTYYSASPAPGDTTPLNQFPTVLGTDHVGHWRLEFDLSNHHEVFTSERGNPQWSNGWVLVNCGEVNLGVGVPGNPTNHSIDVYTVTMYDLNHDGFQDLVRVYWVLAPTNNG